MTSFVLNPDPSMTTLAAAQENTRAGVAQQVAIMNNNLRIGYLNGFNNWTISLLAGRGDGSAPPAPPKAYVMEMGEDGWAYPARGSEPVCSMPPVPEAPKSYTPPSMPEPEDVRSVGPEDPVPAGFIVTAADGAHWQKHASPTPFGMAYYYLKLA